MTNLERLIKAHTEAATLVTISRTTEQIAEDLAREILKDESFRARMRELIARHFTNTIDTLSTNGRRRPRRKARRR